MRQGVHRDRLLASAELADKVLWGNLEKLDWLPDLVNAAGGKHRCADNVDGLIEAACKDIRGPCHIVVMSNGGFGGIHAKLIKALEARV